jgi:single-strand DNA-binding protein
MFNKTFIIGNLTKDPELRYTPSGTAVCNLRLASSTVRKGKNGEDPKEDKLFITAVVWAKRAENCAQYLKKGSQVFVEGRLVTREWEDSAGQRRSVNDLQIDNIHFMDRAKEGTSPETEPGE